MACAPPLSDDLISRAKARLVLTLFALTTLSLVGITLSPLQSGYADAPDRGPGDIQLYRAEVARIHAGESYYAAAAAELHARGYPTASLFNWRTPLPVWLVGTLPQVSLATGLLGISCFVLICAGFHLLADQAGTKQALFGVLLLTGALLPCILGDLVVMSELWAGVFLALSVALFALDRRGLGVVAGLAALLFRELAAPYCLLCVVIALHQRRWRELAWWSVGLTAYAAFYALHAAQVLPRIGPADHAHAAGWIRFGGAGFLIATTQMNAYLLLLPQGVTAVYLACTLLGAASWTRGPGRLVGWTVSLYAIAFSIAGNDFNQYWGAMTAPLFCLAACRAPESLRQLWAAAQLGRAPRRSIAVEH